MKRSQVYLFALATLALVAITLLAGIPSASGEGTVAPAADLSATTDLSRWGVAGGAGSTARVSDLLNMGVRWYQNWQFNPDAAGIGQLTYLPTALPPWRPSDACVSPGDAVTITQKIMQDTGRTKYPAGTVWLIGNEVGLNVSTNPQIWTAQDYARRYRNCYLLLKGIQPYNAEIAARNFQIANGAVLPPCDHCYTNNALDGTDWLRLVRSSYQSQFGAVMPVDVYNIHLYGPPDDRGYRYLVTGTIEFRTAMANEWGARDKPLIVTEVGVKETISWDASIGHMNRMMDFLNSATDANIGNRNDGNRLVQRWAWFADTKPASCVSSSSDWCMTHLYDSAGARTVLGRAYAANAQAAPTATPPPGSATATPTTTRTNTPPPSTPTRTSTAAAATATATGTYEQRVNAGGAAYTDSAGKLWAADKAFSAGSWGYVGGATYAVSSAISGTTDDALYQSERWWSGSANPGYRFTVPAGGQYEVTLKFAEIYQSAPGRRIFSVTIEGATVLSNFDIFAHTGGKFVGHDEVFTVSVTDGELTIGFIKSPGYDNPKINAIQVKKVN